MLCHIVIFLRYSEKRHTVFANSSAEILETNRKDSKIFSKILTSCNLDKGLYKRGVQNAF